ncbi:hypothetical protein DUNSADRAFT_4396 [Dunaliella salina]|uniref:Uncharacterized protein n=1 Tax=Dunaliella salina TaxID=3046 RepID=A0ABQ7GS19_DUNSA|nr:hypothetical protein DUNSADRAFT_4396 [Dunaliella salina]|eukprot:KAF5837416.1 hypothetical protein DUNSADRAFT_4396 [Dunaliella salina]
MILLQGAHKQLLVSLLLKKNATPAICFRGMAVSSRNSTRGGKRGETDDSPRMQAVLAMLSKPDLKKAPQSLKDRQREEDFIVNEHSRHMAWRKDMSVKFRLQKEALAALPRHLRAMAEQPDMSHPPPNRKVLLDTPPEVYRDK